ncbi:hypothetical protein WN944_002473 [Citrus x changshan-huyou]|uniref:HAT C-terminal dimerisation domain-containing protein n=1 Tax=Citrus x changshan-huyou TaxID=2935761 RepID=A0AAP0MGM6_9ROSI
MGDGCLRLMTISIAQNLMTEIIGDRCYLPGYKRHRSGDKSTPSFLEVHGSHTGQVLCDKLMGSLLEFNIERKLPSIIVDNVATNDRVTSFVNIGNGEVMDELNTYLSEKSSTEWISRFTSFVKVKDELDTYLSEKLVLFIVDEFFDILTWWKVNDGNCPILSRIARDILAIPITTIAPEFAFSIGGLSISVYHNRLHLSTLEVLMCSQSWIRAICGAVALTSPAYAKILDEELELKLM